MNRLLIIILSGLIAGCSTFQPRPLSPGKSADAFQARSFNDEGLRRFVEENSVLAPEEWPPKKCDLKLLTLAAFYFHPDLEVARAQWSVARGGNRTAAGRPNPSVSVVPGYNLSAASGVTPWLPALTFDLPIETAGKRGYRIAHSRHLSEAARLNVAAAAWKVRSNLRSSLIDFSAARKRTDLLQQQQLLHEKIIRSLQQQLEAGAVSNSELTLVRIALDKVRLDFNDARLLAAEAFVRVADAIGMPLAALEGLGLEYDFSGLPAASPDLLSSDARRQALQTRADIRAALAEYAASQSALQLEIAKQYPDIHLGPGYQFDQGDHKISLSLTAELPVLNQNQGPIAEAEAKRAEAAARFNALQARVLTEIDRAVAIHRVSRENLSTLESLAASQKKQQEAIEAQWRAGAAAQFDVLNSEFELGATQLLRLNGQVKLHQSLGALEDAIQRPIDSIRPQSIETGPRAQAMKENKP